ncbi:MAG: extracellular solute-binding protein, partial [bacterium]|nr:extracellular solute-binding protein [bacterium]
LIIGGVAGLAVIILFLFLILAGGGGGQQQPATLQFWGAFDDLSFYDSAISAFQRAYPNVKIIYKQISFEDYEKELVNSFAAGTGPDIWLMHNTWLPKHADKIQPLPQLTLEGEKTPLFTMKDFQDQFLDVTLADLTQDGQIYALPIYVDTLGLYYNKDLFNTAGIASPPATWDGFNNDVKILTAVDQRGNIVKSGAAIGTADNINRSTDILTLLMLQSGVRMTDSEHRNATFSQQVEGQNVGETALQYYTNFADPTKDIYAWNSQQHYSVDAFTEGNAVMMFNYSHQIATIRSKSARFNFGIAPVPQISETPVAVNFANYWAPTVSKQSKNPVAAWKFLVYLSSAPGAAPYVNTANRPSARRDLIEQQRNDPDLGVFAVQALSARSWYQIDNSAIETIFAEMIDNVNFGRMSARDALEAAENKVN